MKKLLLIAAFVSVFYGCTNTGMTGNKFPSSVPVFQENTLQQESFYLNDSGIAYLLDILSQNIKSQAVRTYERGDYYDIYMGEYLDVFCGNADTPVIVSAPNAQSFDAFIKNGHFYFRSLYQGAYTFNLMENGVASKTITVNNKSKYKISATDLKNIAVENYNSKNLNNLKNSATLFKLTFPDSADNQEISMLLFNLAVIEGNANTVRTESSFLEENFTLSQADKMRLISGKEKTLGNDYNLSDVYLDFASNSPELNDYVMRNIIKRSNPTGNELIFLENVYAANQTKDLADILGAFYFRAGNVVKGTHYSSAKNGMLPAPLKSSLVTVPEGNESINAGDNGENVTAPEANAEYNEFLANYENGVNYYKEGSYAEAILLFEKCMTAEGDFIEKMNIPFYLGDSYMMSNDYAKAKENFLKLENTNEFYPEAMYKLGDLYYKNGEKDLAVKTFEQNRDNFPGTVWGRRSSIYLLKLK